MVQVLYGPNASVDVSRTDENRGGLSTSSKWGITNTRTGRSNHGSTPILPHLISRSSNAQLLSPLGNSPSVMVLKYFRSVCRPLQFFGLSSLPRYLGIHWCLFAPAVLLAFWDIVRCYMKTAYLWHVLYTNSHTLIVTGCWETVSRAGDDYILNTYSSR